MRTRGARQGGRPARLEAQVQPQLADAKRRHDVAAARPLGLQARGTARCIAAKVLAEGLLADDGVHAIPPPVQALLGRMVGQPLHEQRIADQQDLFVAVAERLTSATAMSSRTLVVATVMQRDETTTPIGRQLMASVFFDLTPNAASRAASTNAALDAASARLMTPNENRPPWPELVSTSPTSCSRPPTLNCGSGNRSNVLALDSSGQRRENVCDVAHVGGPHPVLVEQHLVRRHVRGGALELGQQLARAVVSTRRCSATVTGDTAASGPAALAPMPAGSRRTSGPEAGIPADGKPVERGVLPAEDHLVEFVQAHDARRHGTVVVHLGAGHAIRQPVVHEPAMKGRVGGANEVRRARAFGALHDRLDERRNGFRAAARAGRPGAGRG